MRTRESPGWDPLGKLGDPYGGTHLEKFRNSEELGDPIGGTRCPDRGGFASPDPDGGDPLCHNCLDRSRGNPPRFPRFPKSSPNPQESQRKKSAPTLLTPDPRTLILPPYPFGPQGRKDTHHVQDHRLRQDHRLQPRASALRSHG